MIEFFLGKTGAGKSYLALKRTTEFLADYEDGYVVTNLAINKGKLNAWMKKTFPGLEPDVVGRVRILSDDECRAFFLHREPGNDLLPVTKEQESRLQFPNFEDASKKSSHVLWIIDEAHIFFDAREWAQVGPTLNFFASQHRKFKSDIVLVTQFLDQVEKRLRQHATQFHECQNFGLRRMAFWRMPSVFRVRLTYKAPPCPSEYTQTYRIDPELAACYDTTAGVGVKGGRAPERIRKKGLPFWTAIAAGLLFLVFLYFGPETAAKAFFSYGAFGGPKETPKSNTSVTPPPTGSQMPKAVAKDVESQRPVVTVPQVRVVGYVVKGEKATVWLSDDRVLTEKDPSFGGISPRGAGAWIDGILTPMTKTYIPPPPPPKSQLKEIPKEEKPPSGEELTTPTPAEPENFWRSKHGTISPTLGRSGTSSNSRNVPRGTTAPPGMPPSNTRVTPK